MSTFAEQAAAPFVPRLRAGTALRKAVRSFYEHSFRLVIFNSLFSAVAIAVLRRRRRRALLSIAR